MDEIYVVVAGSENDLFGQIRLEYIFFAVSFCPLLLNTPMEVDVLFLV